MVPLLSPRNEFSEPEKGPTFVMAISGAEQPMGPLVSHPYIKCTARVVAAFVYVSILESGLLSAFPIR
jgi:hypothetical protein